MNLSERIEPRESRPGYYPFDGSGLTDANHRISMHVEDGGRGRDETLPKLEGAGGICRRCGRAHFTRITSLRGDDQNRPLLLS
jgi:hypothetical protein